MTKKLLIILLLFPLTTVYAATERIRIMTYNIPYGNIKVTDGNGQNTWDNRAKTIHAYFASLAPDLIGMQEPVRAELQSLLSGMPGYAMVGMARDDGNEKGEYTPILYRTDRFRVLATDSYWLTDTPDVVSKVEGSTHNRIATWALFEDLQTGAQFLYTNTHLSYNSNAVKYEQIKVLKTHMKEVNDRYGASLPHFLTGDFNMQETEDNGNNYNYVLNYQLLMNDMWINAKNRQHFSGSWSNRIDYIYATRNVNSQYAQWDNRETPDGFIMSDHNPLWADLTFTTSTSDNARAAINQAWCQIDSTFTYTHSRSRLVTSATQLSCDAIEPSYPLANLIDGSTTTYAHSLYSTTAPNNPHYVQVAFRQPVQAFRFQYLRRDGDLGLEDRWQDLMVTASNDGEQWDYVKSIHEFGSVDMRTQTSDVIEMHRPYNYVRINVMHTPAEKVRNSHPQWSASELQLYESTLRSTSEYSTYPEVAAAVDALKQLIAEVEQKVADGTIKRADINALNAATDALSTTRHDATGVTAIADDSVTPAAFYTPDGRRISKPQRGLNIISRAKGTKKIVVR